MIGAEKGKKTKKKAIAYAGLAECPNLTSAFHSAPTISLGTNTRFTMYFFPYLSLFLMYNIFFYPLPSLFLYICSSFPFRHFLVFVHVDG